MKHRTPDEITNLSTETKFTRILGVRVIGTDLETGEVQIDGIDENGASVTEIVNEDSAERRLLKAAKRAAGEKE